MQKKIRIQAVVKKREKKVFAKKLQLFVSVLTFEKLD